MPSFIIVEKNGTVKCSTSKTLNVSDLYKKCNFKSNDGFNCAHTWSIEFNGLEYKLQIYGKIKGKAGFENKYEFPPPIENVLFFGSCAIINTQNGVIVDMNATEFQDIMDYLQGGYSDLDSDEEEESDEDEGLCKTKEGYVKDDFVVDDDEEEMPVKKGKAKVPVPKVPKESTSTKCLEKEPISIIKKTPTKPKIKPIEKPEKPIIQELLECSDELTEDDYV